MEKTTITEIVDLNKKPEQQTTSLAIEPPKPPTLPEPTNPELFDISIMPGLIEILPTPRAELDRQLKDKKERISWISQHAYVVYENSQTVKKIFEVINVLADECTFVMAQDALCLRAMDPSRVAMIALVLPKELSYEFDCQEPMRFCFSVDYLLEKVLKNTYKDEMIRFDIDIHNPLDTIKTQLTQRFKRNFSTPLLESSPEEYPLPKITYDYMTKLVLEDLNLLFKDLEDHVKIVGTKENITFYHSADECTKFHCALEKGGSTVLDIQTSQEEVHAVYSVSYLKELLKALKAIVDIVAIRLSTDMPIEIEADIPHYGSVKFYAAPRIECE